MMQAVVLTLALLVSAAQTVGWVECCCVLICKHHNDPCSDCNDKDKASRDTALDCCKDKSRQLPSHSPGHGKRCAHVQPSSEVATQATDLLPVPIDVVLELPVAAPLPAPPDHDKTNGTFCRARGSPPLHLLYSVLLI